MRITSELICQAADQLNGFVGLNRKTGQYIVRFSEDSFGMDVADDGIILTTSQAKTIASMFGMPDHTVPLTDQINTALPDPGLLQKLRDSLGRNN